jgi:hypothetical protein
MSKRLLSWMFVLTLLFGGAAACGDDDGGSDDSGSEDSGDSGDSGVESSNPDVQDYCDQVTAFADEIADAEGDPAALADLSTQGQELADAAAELSANATDLTTEDSEALAG